MPPKKRRSVALCEEINAAINPDTLSEGERRKLEWEKAITDELKAIGEQYESFVNRYRSNIEKLDKISIDNLQEKIQEMSERVTTLERENKILKNQNAELIKSQAELAKMTNNDDGLIALKQNFISQLDDLAEKTEARFKELEAEGKRTSDAQTLPATNNTRVQLSIPKFKGTPSERPIKFLSEMDAYVNVLQPHARELNYILSQAFEERAKDWWYVVESEIRNYEDFVHAFKDRYWNSSIQRMVRRKLEFGQYNAAQARTRVNHATYIISLVKELDDCPIEEELVMRVADHFGREIRHALQARPIKNKATLFQILTDFDEDDKRYQDRSEQAKNTNAVNRENRSENNRSQQQRPAGPMNNTRSHYTRHPNQPNRGHSMNVLSMNSGGPSKDSGETSSADASRKHKKRTKSKEQLRIADELDVLTIELEPPSEN